MSLSFFLPVQGYQYFKCYSAVTKAIEMNSSYLLYIAGMSMSECSVCNPDSHTQERWPEQESLGFEVILGYIPSKAFS